MPDLQVVIGESVEGFFEGLLAPFFELIIATLVVVGVSVSQAFASAGIVSPINVASIFALFAVIELIRNFGMGFALPFGGVGYIVGAFIGLSWLADAIPNNSGAVILSAIFVFMGIAIRGYLFASNLDRVE
jgi:hypothetical protein